MVLVCSFHLTLAVSRLNVYGHIQCVYDLRLNRVFVHLGSSTHILLYFSLCRAELHGLHFGPVVNILRVVVHLETYITYMSRLEKSCGMYG